MFKLVIIIVLFINGKQIAEHKLESQVSFDSVEKCNEQKTSKAHKAAETALREIIKGKLPKGGSFKLSAECKQFDDGSI